MNRHILVSHFGHLASLGLGKADSGSISWCGVTRPIFLDFLPACSNDYLNSFFTDPRLPGRCTGSRNKVRFVSWRLLETFHMTNDKSNDCFRPFLRIFISRACRSRELITWILWTSQVASPPSWELLRFICPRGIGFVCVSFVCYVASDLKKLVRNK